MKSRSAAKGRYVSFGSLGMEEPVCAGSPAQAAGDVPSESHLDVERDSSSAPGTFSLLYESKDGRLCTFEDSQGHLTSVDSSRLA